MRFTGRYFLRILSVALVSVLTLLVAACSGDSGPAGAGSIVIAVEEVPPMIQDPRRDFRASGGIGIDLSVYETIVRAPHVAPPAPPPGTRAVHQMLDGEPWKCAELAMNLDVADAWW